MTATAWQTSKPAWTYALWYDAVHGKVLNFALCSASYVLTGSSVANALASGSFAASFETLPGSTAFSAASSSYTATPSSGSGFNACAGISVAAGQVSIQIALVTIDVFLQSRDQAMCGIETLGEDASLSAGTVYDSYQYLNESGPTSEIANWSMDPHTAGYLPGIWQGPVLLTGAGAWVTGRYDLTSLPTGSDAGTGAPSEFERRTTFEVAMAPGGVTVTEPGGIAPATFADTLSTWSYSQTMAMPRAASPAALQPLPTSFHRTLSYEQITRLEVPAVKTFQQQPWWVDSMTYSVGTFVHRGYANAFLDSILLLGSKTATRRTIMIYPTAAANPSMVTASSAGGVQLNLGNVIAGPKYDPQMLWRGITGSTAGTLLRKGLHYRPV